MVSLELHLQEGFVRTHVVIRREDQIVAELNSLSTDVRIGLAQVVPVVARAGDEITLELPGDAVTDARFTVSPDTEFVTVSVVQGAFVIAFPDRLPGYL